LTSDQLEAVGVCELSKLSTAKENMDDAAILTKMSKLPGEAALVLAGCHSLVVFEEETTGDPLESAALKSMNWHISTQSGNAEPAPAIGKRPAGTAISIRGEQITSLQIMTRHHFSSKLQRMSCVVKANGKNYAVAKGSPEAIANLLTVKPSGYDEKAAFLSKQGFRVIGLAYRTIESIEKARNAMDSRAACESELTFAGFIAFTCMVRKDTRKVLYQLKEGGMSVAIVTGDAVLTAIHVAKEVHVFEPINKPSSSTEEVIEDKELASLLEAKRETKGLKPSKKGKKVHYEFRPILYLDNDDGALCWRSYDDDARVQDYRASDLPVLATTHDLATTGKILDQAYENDPDTRRFLQHIKVFARMTPVAKETVIECLQSVGLLCLMNGDGSNDGKISTLDEKFRK
jgi:manganese-transporting P-type ATPase